MDTHRGYACLGVDLDISINIPMRYAEDVGNSWGRMHRSRCNVGLYQRGQYRARFLFNMAAICGRMETTDSFKAQDYGHIVLCDSNLVSL